MQCSQSRWEADNKSRIDEMSLTISGNEKKGEGMVLAIS